MHDIKSLSNGYIIPIDRAILHEDFESDYLHDTNDIALLKLSRTVRYNDKVQPICLPARGIIIIIIMLTIKNPYVSLNISIYVFFY